MKKNTKYFHYEQTNEQVHVCYKWDDNAEVDSADHYHNSRRANSN